MRTADPEVKRRLNAFLKHTKGKCPIIAYVAPIPPIIECIVEHRLASGVAHYIDRKGDELGAWFFDLEGRETKRMGRGPGGVGYERYPEWEEVDPPGEPVPRDGPVKYTVDLTDEAVQLIKSNKLFFYSFLYFDNEGRLPEYFDIFGDRFIPGLVMEADMSVFPHMQKVHREKPFADRDEAYGAAVAYMRKAIEQSHVYGLAGSGVDWYQGAQFTKQKRWDHELANQNKQVQAAFLRGVAQQHGIPFITYIAPMGNSPEGLWGTKADPETPFGKVFNCTYFAGGKPDHLLEREWFHGWFSGPEALVLEASEFFLFKKGQDEQTFEPGCMAEACRKLNHLAFESDFDRGTPYRPAAILMDERHGWTFPGAPDAHSWDPPGITARKIWGVFDYQHEDFMVDNFFGAIYPGYEYGGSWGMKYGDLVQTPYGDSFDVLTSNAKGKALGKYPATFVVGRPKLTRSLKTRLEKYMESGGTLVLNISQVDYAWRDFLGVKLSPKFNRWYQGLGTLRASDWSEWLDPNAVWEEERYHYSRVESGGAEVLAVTEQGDPLVLRQERGKGCVYLVTAHFMQEISGLHRPNGLLNVGQHLIGHVLEPQRKIRTRGPEIHYMVNETPSGLAVMLLNNRDRIWNGWVTFPDMAGAECKEWYAEERLHRREACGDASVRLNIPPYSLRIITVTRE